MKPNDSLRVTIDECAYCACVTEINHRGAYKTVADVLAAIGNDDLMRCWNCDEQQEPEEPHTDFNVFVDGVRVYTGNPDDVEA